MPRPLQPKPSTPKIEAALRRVLGNISEAAKILRVPRTSLTRWVASDPELTAVRDECREVLVDKAETALLAILEDPKHPKHATMVIYVLRSQGRARGWGQKVEVEHVAPARTDVPSDLIDKTPEELREKLRAIEGGRGS